MSNAKKALAYLAIFIIASFGINEFLNNGLPKAMDCGTGWTANIQNKNCTLNTNTAITKEIPSRTGQMLMFLPSALMVAGFMILIEIFYMLAKAVSTKI